MEQHMCVLGMPELVGSQSDLMRVPLLVLICLKCLGIAIMHA
jgi:hypothetical protein